MERCIYCECECSPLPGNVVPPADDDGAWERLAGEHSVGCEWIETRAHQVQSAADYADERRVCSVIGCNKTAAVRRDGGPETGSHWFCHGHNTEAAVTDLGDYVAEKCCY
jgi:hypothetical protein